MTSVRSTTEAGSCASPARIILSPWEFSKTSIFVRESAKSPHVASAAAITPATSNHHQSRPICACQAMMATTPTAASHQDSGTRWDSLYSTRVPATSPGFAGGGVDAPFAASMTRRVLLVYLCFLTQALPRRRLRAAPSLYWVAFTGHHLTHTPAVSSKPLLLPAKRRYSCIGPKKVRRRPCRVEPHEQSVGNFSD